MEDIKKCTEKISIQSTHGALLATKRVGWWFPFPPISNLLNIKIASFVLSSFLRGAEGGPR